MSAFSALRLADDAASAGHRRCASSKEFGIAAFDNRSKEFVVIETEQPRGDRDLAFSGFQRQLDEALLRLPQLLFERKILPGLGKVAARGSTSQRHDLDGLRRDQSISWGSGDRLFD